MFLCIIVCNIPIYKCFDKYDRCRMAFSIIILWPFSNHLGHFFRSRSIQLTPIIRYRALGVIKLLHTYAIHIYLTYSFFRIAHGICRRPMVISSKRAYRRSSGVHGMTGHSEGRVYHLRSRKWPHPRKKTSLHLRSHLVHSMTTAITLSQSLLHGLRFPLRFSDTAGPRIVLR